VLDDDRRGPRSFFIARRSPKFVAGFLVECRDEARPFVIPIDDDRVAEQGRRAPFPKRKLRLHPAQVLFPLQIPIHVVAMQSARAEIGDDILAVGDGRIRGKRIVELRAFVRHFLASHFPPNRLSGFAIETKQDELIRLGRPQVRGRTTAREDKPRSKASSALKHSADRDKHSRLRAPAIPPAC
jgi:hypothetical protein